jgi:hypothetical protein
MTTRLHDQIYDTNILIRSIDGDIMSTIHLSCLSFSLLTQLHKLKLSVYPFKEHLHGGQLVIVRRLTILLLLVVRRRHARTVTLQAVPFPSCRRLYRAADGSQQVLPTTWVDAPMTCCRRWKWIHSRKRRAILVRSR